MTTKAPLNTTALDKALEDLHAGAPNWVAVPLKDKMALPEVLPPKILDLGPHMVAVADKLTAALGATTCKTSHEVKSQAASGRGGSCP